MQRTPSVSIIICCYNSSARLPTTLEYIGKLSLKKHYIELIIVDNNSSDQTPQVAKEVWSKNTNLSINLLIVKESNQGLSSARKKGIEVSKGEYIIFCDDDNWLQRDYVLNAIEIMEGNPDVGACGGQIDAVFEIEKPEWFELVGTSYAVGKQLEFSGIVPISRGYLWGAGLVVRRSAWFSIATRNNLLLSDRKKKELSSGGDTEMCILLQSSGWKLWYDEKLKLKHFITSDRLKWKHALKLYRGFGKSSVILSAYFHLLRKDDHSQSKPVLTHWKPELKRLYKQFKKNRASHSLERVVHSKYRLRMEFTIGRLFAILKMRKGYNRLFD